MAGQPKGSLNQTKESSALTELMAENKNTSQFVGFRLDDQEYAFRIEQIQEIIILKSVTQTPQVAHFVDGVSNLRGTIIPIINLRKLFGIDPIPKDAKTRTIVVYIDERTMGCTVDSVTQVIRIPSAIIQPAPEVVKGNGNAYIVGYAKLNERLIVLLDINQLLNSEKFDQVNQSTLNET
ncbi:MAG: chemotaxis protein CheW [Pirellulales bacterium]